MKGLKTYMEDKESKDTLYDLLSPKQLADHLHDEFTSLYTDENIGGTLTMPSAIPKSLEKKLSRMSLMVELLKYKLDKEGGKYS